MRSANDRRVEHGAGPRRLNDWHDSDLNFSGELRAPPGGSLSPIFVSAPPLSAVGMTYGLRADMYALSHEIRGTGVGLKSFAFEIGEIGLDRMVSALCADFSSLSFEARGISVDLESAACPLSLLGRLSALHVDMYNLDPSAAYEAIYRHAWQLQRLAALALDTSPIDISPVAPALEPTRAASAAPALEPTRAASAAPALELPPAASAALALELPPPASAASAAPALELTRAAPAAPALAPTRAV